MQSRISSSALFRFVWLVVRAPTLGGIPLHPDSCSIFFIQMLVSFEAQRCAILTPFILDPDSFSILDMNIHSCRPNTCMLPPKGQREQPSPFLREGVSAQTDAAASRPRAFPEEAHSQSPGCSASALAQRVSVVEKISELLRTFDPAHEVFAARVLHHGADEEAVCPLVSRRCARISEREALGHRGPNGAGKFCIDD